MARTKSIQKTGVKASKQFGVVDNDNAFIVEALDTGVEGNEITVTIVDPAGNNAPLSVDVTGTDIVVNLATDGESDPVSTADEVIDAINDDADALDLVSARTAPGSNGSGVVAAAPETPLEGGEDGKVHNVVLDEPVTDPEGPLAVQIPDDEYADATGRDALAVHERPAPSEVIG